MYLLLLVLGVTSCALPPVPYFPTSAPLDQPVGAYGEALYLTPLLDRGDLDQARELSSVGPIPNVPTYVESYAGYLTTNDTYGSNMFFWYFPAVNNRERAETMIWMQGGPGESTLYGIFMENGPYNIYDKYFVSMRKYSWNEDFNVIYMDTPVGTGFSFTNDTLGYATSSAEAAEEVYGALLQLFRIFTELQTNDFYVAAESFAGEYAVLLSRLLQVRKPAEIKFAGMLAGNPVLDFDFELTGQLLFAIGLINEEQMLVFKEGGSEYRQLVEEGNLIEAAEVRSSLLFGIEGGQTYFSNVTGFVTNTNFAFSYDLANIETYLNYISIPQFRRAIHVGSNDFSDGSQVVQYMTGSLTRPVNQALGHVMNEYKVMLYYGQNDCLVTYLASVRLLMNNMSTWRDNQVYEQVDRGIWKVDADDLEVAGYVTQVDKFQHVLVRNAGHMAVNSQPRATQDMVRRFIRNLPFTN